MFKIPQNPGFIPRKPDPRDVPFKAVLGTIPKFDWSKPFDLRNEMNLKAEDQGPSSSCVAQAWSKYAEVKEMRDAGKPLDLSARDIYSRIWLPPDGGAWGYKGGSVLINRGCTEEAVTPSYSNGKPPSEEFMRIRNENPVARQNASMKRISGYTVVSPNMDEVALSASLNDGCVIGVLGSDEGWQTAQVRPPKRGERTWGHFFYIVGATKEKQLPFQNWWSDRWGEGGFGYLSEDYFNSGLVFSGYAMQDIPNRYLKQIQMKRLIRAEGGTDQYIVNENVKVLIPDVDTLAFLQELEIVPKEDAEVLSKSVFDSFVTHKTPLPSVKADKINKEFYEFYKDRLPVLQDAYEPGK